LRSGVIRVSARELLQEIEETKTEMRQHFRK
jgi:predicted RNA-binding protein with PIN domain